MEKIPWREKTIEQKIERVADGAIECAVWIAVFQPLILMIVGKFTDYP